MRLDNIFYSFTYLIQGGIRMTTTRIATENGYSHTIEHSADKDPRNNFSQPEQTESNEKNLPDDD